MFSTKSKSLYLLLISGLYFSFSSCSKAKDEEPEDQERCFADAGTVETKGNQIFLCDIYTGGSIFSVPNDKTYWQLQLTCPDSLFPPRVSESEKHGTCSNIEGDIKGASYAFCSEFQRDKWFEANSGDDNGYFYFNCTAEFDVRGIPDRGWESQNLPYGPYEFCRNAERATMSVDRLEPTCANGELVGKIFE